MVNSLQGYLDVVSANRAELNGAQTETKAPVEETKELQIPEINVSEEDE